MDESIELLVFQQFYPKLCVITDIDNLLKYFYQESIISYTENEEIQHTIKKEKVSKFLAIIHDFLKRGSNKIFYDMLKVMKCHGLEYTQTLADQIKLELKKHSNGK